MPEPTDALLIYLMVGIAIGFIGAFFLVGVVTLVRMAWDEMHGEDE